MNDEEEKSDNFSEIIKKKRLNSKKSLFKKKGGTPIA